MKIKTGIIIGLFIVIAAFIGFNIINPYYFKRIEGNKIIAKIEKFHGEHKKYPDRLEDIGITETEEGPFYYKKESENEYIVWFGTSLGESEIYYSKKKKWGY